jgi:gamma-glutamylcyclotransferase
MLKNVTSTLGRRLKMTSPCDAESFLYFSYGSNMSTERIRVANPSAQVVGPALLEDYFLDFNFYSKRWHGAPATITADTSSQVFGVLWCLNLKHLASIDDQEGVPSKIYRRFRVEVTPLNEDGSKVSAFVYQLLAERCTSTGDAKLPSKAYLEVILKGAREHKLPQFYIRDKLEKIRHNGYDGVVDLNVPARK